jgi:hypothetical protein
MGNRKQYILGGLIGLGVVAAAGSVIWALQEWISEDIDQAAGILPADTLFVVAFKDLDQMHEDFSKLLKMDLVEDNPELAEGLELLEDELGLDITDLDDLESTGLDFTGVWAFAAVVDDEDDIMKGGAVYFLAPIHDGEDASDFVIDRLEDAGLEVDEENIDDYDAWVIEINGDESLAFMVKEDFLVFAYDVDITGQGDGIGALEDLVDMDETLDQTETFKRVKEELGDEWNAFVYARMDTVDEMVKGWLESEGLDDLSELDELAPMMDEMGSYEAMGMTIGINREQWSMRAAMLRNDGLWEELSGDGKDNLAKYVEGTPLVALRTSYDLGGYWEYIEDLYGDMEEFDEAMYEFERETDLDLEKDIVRLFTGNISLVVLEGSGFIPIDLLIWAEVTDEDDAIELLEDLVDLAEYEGMEIESEEESQITWYFTDIDMVSPSLGVSRDHLIFSLFDGARDDLSDTLEDPDQSFVDELPDSLQDEFEDGPIALFWMDIDGVLDALDDVPELRNDQEWEMVRLVFSPFKDIIGRYEVDGEMMSSEVIVRAADGDFIPAIEDAVEDGIKLAEEMDAMGYIDPPPYPPPDWDVDTGGPDMDYEEVSPEGVEGADASEFYELGEIQVQLSGSDGAPNLVMEIAVEGGADPITNVEARQYQVRDMILMIASGYTRTELEGLDGKLRLRDEIHLGLNAILSPYKIDRVYYTRFAFLE